NRLGVAGVRGSIAVAAAGAVIAGARADRFGHQVALLESHLPFDATWDTPRHRILNLPGHTPCHALIDHIFFPPRLAVGNLPRDRFVDHPAGADRNAAHAFFLHHAAARNRNLVTLDFIRITTSALMSS